MRGLTAALVVVAVVVSGCGDGGFDGGLERTTSSSDATTTTEVTTSSQPGLVDSAIVTAGPDGVQVISPEGTSTTVSTDPAAVAFGVGADVIVFQNADRAGGRFPAPGTGAVQVWTEGDVRALAVGPSARRTLLLDAAMVEGAPLVLVAERFGEVGPDDTFEELVQIDLREDTRTTIARRSAWESGHSAARFLPDGDVVGVFSSEASVFLARWTATGQQPIWTTQVGVDIHVDLALSDGEITLIASSFDTGRNFTPVLRIAERDTARGIELSSNSVDVHDPEGEIDTGLFCWDWISPMALVCGRSSGKPIVISLRDGSFEQLPAQRESIPTVFRRA